MRVEAESVDTRVEAGSAYTRAEAGYRTDVIRLDNGLEIAGEWNPNARSVAIGFFVRTGARDETVDRMGVSHFLEHMIFKGSETLSADAVNRVFDEIGARYNASTSSENTIYHGAVLPERQGDLLGFYLDLLRPALRQEDFDMEKKVILEEIARADDSPLHLLHTEARRLLLGDHPLAYRTLGTVETIERLERAAMIEYHHRRYTPGNIRLVLAGNYDWDRAVDQTGERTAGWMRSEAPRDLTVPPVAGGVRFTRGERFARAHFYWMAPGFAEQDPRRYVAAVAGAVIGSRRGSRLYRELVETGIADSASFGHSGGDGVGSYAGIVSCDPSKAREVVDAFRRILHEAVDEGLSEREMVGPRRKIAAGHVLRNETPMGRMMSIGYDRVYHGTHESVAEEVSRVMGVSVVDANSALSAIPIGNAVLAGLGPIDTAFEESDWAA